MTLQSSDIKSKTFNTRLRGFDQEEVTNYLNEVSQAYEALTQENQALNEKIERLSESLDEYVEKHDSLNRSILVAQDAADRLKEDAHAEANHLVSEARDEADRIRKASREEAHKLLSEAISKVHFVQKEMEALRQESVTFKKDLHDMLKVYHSTIMDNRWDKVMNLKTLKQINLDQTKEAVELAAQLSDKEEGQEVAMEIPAEEQSSDSSDQAPAAGKSEPAQESQDENPKQIDSTTESTNQSHAPDA